MKNFKLAISNFFAHARLREHVVKGFDPLAGIPMPKAEEKEVGIYSPDELLRLLQNAPREMIPYYAIGAFAGLRQSELDRLDWVEVKQDHIRILGSKTKTKVKRLVPILPNLAAWLQQVRRPSGPIETYGNLSNQVVKVAKKADLKSQHNGLRHSFASYRLALEKNPAAVAYELGNTPRVVTRNYLKVVMEVEAMRWFSIYPNVDGKAVFRLDQQPALRTLGVSA